MDVIHPDHAGAAAEIAAWADVEVCAHHADSPFLRGDVPGPTPTWPTGSGPSSTRSAASCPPRPGHRHRCFGHGEPILT
jgi:glyoxylase-like metal-dependent hydrolase (beta-lactamase superfamily II)